MLYLLKWWKLGNKCIFLLIVFVNSKYVCIFVIWVNKLCCELR